MLNIYFNYHHQLSAFRGALLLKQGLEQSKQCNWVSDANEADIAFVLDTQLSPLSADKTVVIDLLDSPYQFVNTPCFAYFKRSLVTERLANGNRQPIIVEDMPYLYPFWYGVLDEYIRPVQPFNTTVGCYLRGTQEDRANVLIRLYNEHFPNSYIGQVNNFLRNGFDDYYFNQLAQTELIVTCSPTKWEGDHRFWEAMVNCGLVFSDEIKMHDSLPYSPVSGRDFISYNPTQLDGLVNDLYYYLNEDDDGDRYKIMERGRELALKHHRAVNRVDYIINMINNNLSSSECPNEVSHNPNKYKGD